MNLDLAVFGVVAVFGLLGLISGLIRQVSHWVALVAAYLLSQPISAALTPAAAAKFGWPAGLVQVGLSSLVFTGVLIVGALLCQILLGKILGGVTGPAVNRGGGLILGAAKAAAVCYVLLSAVLFFEKPLGDFLPSARSALKTSEVADVIRRRNLFTKVRLPALDNVTKLLAAAKDPKAVKKLREDPKLKELMSDPRLKAMLTDSGLSQAAAGGDAGEMLGSMDLSSLMSDPKMAGLLEDPKLKELLSGLESGEKKP